MNIDIEKIINDKLISTINRNRTFDLLKVYAMFSVVLDHSLKRWISGIQNTQLYNFIFLSQMPIFMFVAGYFFYKNIKFSYSMIEFQKKLEKIILSFLIPFISFSLITSVIKGEFKSILLNLINSFLIPDNSLWFLWALMWIEVFMLIAQQIGKYLMRKKVVDLTIIFIKSIIIYAILLIPIGIIYLKFPTYFETKLIIYYSIFFIIGLTSHCIEEQYNWKFNESFNIIMGEISLIIIILVMYFHPSIMNDEESIVNMLIRILGSIACIIFIRNLLGLLVKLKVFNIISLIGSYSLELYYMHLVIFKFQYLNQYISFTEIVKGIMEYISLYSITILISFILIFIVKKNKLLNFILFGKTE